MPLSILRYTHTAVDNTSFLVLNKETWLEYADIFCYDQDALFGDAGTQDVSILAGDSYNIPHPVNIRDLFFKNAAAGANTRIVIVGTPYRGE